MTVHLSCLNIRWFIVTVTSSHETMSGGFIEAITKCSMRGGYIPIWRSKNNKNKKLCETAKLDKESKGGSAKISIIVPY